MVQQPTRPQSDGEGSTGLKRKRGSSGQSYEEPNEDTPATPSLENIFKVHSQDNHQHRKARRIDHTTEVLIGHGNNCNNAKSDNEMELKDEQGAEGRIPTPPKSNLMPADTLETTSPAKIITEKRMIKVGSSLRIAQACDRCRKKKIRCDGTRPCCSQCADVSLECKTSDKLRRQATPRGYTESLEEQVRTLEAKVGELQLTCASGKPFSRKFCCCTSFAGNPDQFHRPEEEDTASANESDDSIHNIAGSCSATIENASLDDDKLCIKCRMIDRDDGNNATLPCGRCNSTCHIICVGHGMTVPNKEWLCEDCNIIFDKKFSLLMNKTFRYADAAADEDLGTQLAPRLLEWLRSTKKQRQDQARNSPLDLSIISTPQSPPRILPVGIQPPLIDMPQQVFNDRLFHLLHSKALHLESFRMRQDTALPCQFQSSHPPSRFDYMSNFSEDLYGNEGGGVAFAVGAPNLQHVLAPSPEDLGVRTMMRMGPDDSEWDTCSTEQFNTSTSNMVITGQEADMSEQFSNVISNNPSEYLSTFPTPRGSRHDFMDMVGSNNNGVSLAAVGLASDLRTKQSDWGWLTASL